MAQELRLLSLDFKADQVIYNTHTMPTGTLACQALNIPRECIEQIQNRTSPLTALKDDLNHSSCSRNLLEPAKASIHEILSLMQKQPPFRYLDVEIIHKTIEELFQPEMSIVYPELCKLDRRSVSDEQLLCAFFLKDQFEQYVFLLEHLGYSLGQYLDGMTEFAQELDSLPNRKPDGLARATAKFFPNLISLDDESSWMSGMNESCQYLAMKDNNGSPVMGRRHHYVSVVGMLRADLFEGLAVGHAPKKCATCGKWFLTTDGRHTKYCGGVDPNSPKALTCRQVGNRKGKENREKAEDHPLKAIYETRCASIRKRVSRNTLSPELGEEARRIAKNKLNRAIRDNAYARNGYATEMELSVLLKEAELEVG